MLVVGSIVALLPESLTTSPPAARGWQATAALDAYWPPSPLIWRGGPGQRPGGPSGAGQVPAGGRLAQDPAPGRVGGGSDRGGRRRAGLPGPRLGSRSPAQLDASWPYLVGWLATGLATSGRDRAVGHRGCRHGEAPHARCPGCGPSELVLGAVARAPGHGRGRSPDTSGGRRLSPRSRGWSRSWPISARRACSACGGYGGPCARAGGCGPPPAGRRSSTRPLSGHTAVTSFDDLRGGLAGGPSRPLQQQRRIHGCARPAVPCAGARPPLCLHRYGAT